MLVHWKFIANPQLNKSNAKLMPIEGQSMASSKPKPQLIKIKAKLEPLGCQIRANLHANYGKPKSK